LSGVSGVAPSQVLSADGGGQTATGTCFDAAGNSASDSVGEINIDLTAPVISLASITPANGNGWNDTAVAADWTCADALSGAVTTHLHTDLAAEGAGQVASATCIDLAGNTASASRTVNIDLTSPTIAFSSR